MTDLLVAARKLDSHGFNVLPADLDRKLPAMWHVGEAKEWKRWQTERTTPFLMRWFREGRPASLALCVVTGKISRIVVLDIDSPKAYDAWADRLGRGVLEGTAYVRTQHYEKKGGGGVGHYYFRIDSEMHVRSSSQSDEQKRTGVLWDLKAEGGHVMVPPSPGYVWIRTPEAMLDLPDHLASVANEFKRDASEVETATGRSTLTALLERLPNTTEGEGRNVLLTRIAGHYAKDNRNFRDRFVYHVRDANQKFPDPLPDTEVDKMIESIWSAESAKPEFHATDENGYLALADGRDHLYVLRTVKDAPSQWDDWANFAPEVIGVMDAEDDVIYDIKLHRRGKRDDVRTQLPASVLGNLVRLNEWLARHAVSLDDPSAGKPRMPANVRLHRYIEDQDAPHFQVAHYLGWHRGSGFITHDGVITPDGMAEFGVHRPEPILLKRAPYRYGFEPGAVGVLREVLTYHHPEVAAVFGSWWAACFLKPQLTQVASLFPFMALEAPSESGKTKGFFSLMLSLGGNTKGQLVPTAASLRDYVSAHQSGIVWVDDMDSIDHLTEVLRAATGDGTMVKKGEDRTSQVEAHLVAPMVVSGEHLGLDGQKALQDRAIRLNVPSPTQRCSASDPERLQWDDIVDLKRRHPDLTVFAGSLVQEFLARADLTDQLADYRPRGGRFSDKLAIVRLGARILADVTGLDWIVPTVDTWAEVQEDQGDENALTLKILPLALSWYNLPDKPSAATEHRPRTPAFIRSGTLWVSPFLLAEWWDKHRNGRIIDRTESRGALEQQAKVMGIAGKPRRFRLEGLEVGNQRYWEVPKEVAKAVLERAEGVAYDRVSGISHETSQGVLATPRMSGRRMIGTNDPEEAAAWLRGEEPSR